MVSLSLAGGNTSDNTIKFVCHLGIAASKDVLLWTMKGISEGSAATWEWQAHHLFIVLFFDNMQYELPHKIQVDGRSTNMVEGTSHFAQMVVPYVPPARVSFVTSEGQPEMTYIDQAVPAPMNFLLMNHMNDCQFKRLL